MILSHTLKLDNFRCHLRVVYDDGNLCNLMILFSHFLHLQTADIGSSQIRVRVIKGKSLAKKDIFGASDPYVKIDLHTINDNAQIDSVLTKTRKKVRIRLL